MMFKCLLIAVCIAAIDCEPMSFVSAMKKCGSSVGEMLNFLKKGEFRAGKENKCVFECIVKATEMVDSDFNFDVNKLKKMAENNNRFIPGLKTILSEPVLKKCLNPTAEVSNCDKAYNFIKCAVDEKNKIQSEERQRRIDERKRKIEERKRKTEERKRKPKATTPKVDEQNPSTEPDFLTTSAGI